MLPLDTPHQNSGLYVLRGDNIVMLGEVDEERENGLKRVDAETIMHAIADQDLEEADKQKKGWDFDLIQSKS